MYFQLKLSWCMAAWHGLKTVIQIRILHGYVWNCMQYIHISIWHGRRPESFLIRIVQLKASYSSTTWSDHWQTWCWKMNFGWPVWIYRSHASFSQGSYWVSLDVDQSEEEPWLPSTKAGYDVTMKTLSESYVYRISVIMQTWTYRGKFYLGNHGICRLIHLSLSWELFLFSPAFAQPHLRSFPSAQCGINFYSVPFLYGFCEFRSLASIAASRSLAAIIPMSSNEVAFGSLEL